ncbi:Branched-chain amino acid transport protein [Pseudorhodobacter antarcticus]|jgi:branched-subunit amino acid transport protein|uniref:Branched-chain amino acid transport protein n=1 Tax=Pseudorhodobacter antarcticus TaxID=1077947 RepID=A0A1H8EB76_9RHOB|nr:AzlD domain-containing protein [Pseudorhodobacter antarcticus]SEN16008.1 Branched-chain amino acid transport protein [Pseudorhodobacter antarcticus]
MIPDSTFWFVTAVLGVGTYLIRFSFLGLLGGRQLPDWLLVHLRYVGVAVLPALVTPMILWPAANGGQLDPLRMIAAAAAMWAGWRLGVVWAIVVGMGTLWGLQYLTSQFHLG